MATATWKSIDPGVPRPTFIGAARRRLPAAHLLEEDPGLAARLSAADRARLDPLLRVPVHALGTGSWEPAGAGCEPDTFGLLVLEGWLLRDLRLGRRGCAELLGPGDVLRPGVDPCDGGASVPADACMRVLEAPARLAVLDRRASLLIGRFPALTSELLDRALIRARALQFQLALTQVPGIPARLLMLLWHLADRWGHTSGAGVVLPLDLTHETLGLMIGARRPSVTTALGRLVTAGAIERGAEGWLLRMDPAELELEPRRSAAA